MKKLFVLLGFILLLWFAYTAWYHAELRAVDPGSTEKVYVTIPQGSSLSKTADILKVQGLIRSSAAFARLARAERVASKIQAGTFILNASMDAEEVLQALTVGSGSTEMRITIPEGYTVKDIDALLVEKGLIKAGEIKITQCAQACTFESADPPVDFLPVSASKLADRGGQLEGYLFPDTYFISTSGFSAKVFLTYMLQNFRKKVIDSHSNEVQSSGHSLSEIITMASLIEKETRSDDERPIVAGILWKRLREGMRLDVDAAVRYALDKPTDKITANDLESDSPYNLRHQKGLPPGPISNPGLKSIEAALHPKESEYYYYLHDSAGKIHYAKTNDEQNANRAKYLR